MKRKTFESFVPTHQTEDLTSSFYEIVVLGKRGKLAIDEEKVTLAAEFDGVPDSCDSRHRFDTLRDLLELDVTKKKPEPKKTPGSLKKSSDNSDAVIRNASQLPNDWSLHQSCTIISDNEESFVWFDNRSKSDWLKGLSGSSPDVYSSSTVFEYPPSQMPYAILKSAFVNEVSSIHSSNRSSWKTLECTSDTFPKTRHSDNTNNEGGLFKSNAQVSRHEKVADHGGKASLSEYVFNRRCEWGSSFESIYRLVEEGASPYFYYMEQEGKGSISRIALFFGANIVAEGSSMYVIVSGATASFREQLHSQQIEFTCPFDTASETTECSADIQEEFKELMRAQSCMSVHAQASRVPVAESNTLLCVSGRQNIIGYFTFLLNRVVRRGGAHMLPKLISPVMFEGAFSKCPISKPPVIATQAETHQVSKTLELQCPYVLPTQIPKLTDAIMQLEGSTSNLTFSFPVVPQTQHFNRAVQLLRGKNYPILESVDKIYSEENVFKVTYFVPGQ